MEKIEPGKYVEIAYDLYEITPKGEELVYETDKKSPERIVFGVTRGLLPALERALIDMKPGEKFDVIAEAKDAFGPHDPEQVAKLERDVFLVDGKFDEDFIKPGAVVPMMTADGYRIDGKVLAVTDKEVELDFNHPLAGKDVHFKGEIMTVRDATPEELHPTCGCGCGHDHCGDGCGDNCGDGCGDHDGCGCH